MTRKAFLYKTSICIPRTKHELQVVERLIKLGEKEDRSVNYLVVETILEYLDREEKK